MNLDLFNNLKNNENINNFLGELLNYLKKDNNLGIIEKVKNENKISENSENKMINKQNDILKNYADKTKERGALYFINCKAKKENKYIVFKYENNKESTIKLEEKQLPKNFKINDILRKEEKNFIVDLELTDKVKEQIQEMAEEIIENQNKKLEGFRKENHLYVVEEDRNDRVYLKDITLNSGLILEEVDFPKELIGQATEGTTVKYVNGEYKINNN